jgi:hypothetical protein
MTESGTRKAARHILETMQRQYGAPNTMVSAAEADFAHLDLAAYRTFRAAREGEGFRHVGDLEVLEVSRSPTSLLARTMLRSMVSEDGFVVSDYYQVKPRIGRYMKLLARGLRNLRFIDAPRSFARGMHTRHCIGFSTEFDDGTSLVTSNAQAASLISGPATIESHYFPFGTPSPVLLQAHRARVEEILCAKPQMKPVAIASLSDLLQMYKRQSTQKAAYRATAQWITKAELEGMSAGRPEIANAVFSEVRKLLDDGQPEA